MTSLEELKQLIDYIHRRLPSEEKIDAAEHNRILKTLVDTLAGIGANVFLGITTPETIPEQSPAIKCFYLATKKGNYPHFGDLVINSPLAVIYWNGFDWEKHEIEVSVNVNVDINDFVDLSNFAKLTADNEFVGNQKIIGSLEIGETRGKLRPAVTRNREMADGNATVWDDLLKVIKTVKQVPDSKLFNEHAWEDWFNQALRTFDDVKFKSLKSTEFETKVKGWIIDAMGDAEFRKLILREGFKTADFIPGVLGAGTGMVGTEDFTTGKLTVRNYMEVMALAIAQVFWRGGQDVYSPSGMKVNKVEEYGDYWRCYMDTSEGQVNTCTIGAQMRCDKYGDGKKKYYWNLVTNTGENYIDLSKTDRDGVDVPEVGDELAQFGHRTDPNLSWILVISSMSEDAGMTMYAGVDSYTLSGKWAIRVGKDPNGSNRVGIFTKNGEFSDVIEGLEEKIQDAIAKTVDITAPSQVFKYEAAYTGTPTPASILLMALPRNFTPTSYQWQFLNGSTWTNISGATSSTYSVAPGNTTLFPPGVYTRTFRCVCNGDEKLSDNFTLAKLADGAIGQPGVAGKGVKSTVVTYQDSTSGTTAPTGTWLASIPPVAAGSYLWSKTEITYTDNSKSTMYSVARMGTNGTNGNAGNGVSGTVVTYQASTSGTTAPTGTWSNTIPPVSAGSFLWTKTVISYTNGTSSTIYSVGKMGNTGTQGIPGESVNGKMLYKDPEFKVGLNGTRTYGAQNGGGTVVISRTKKSTGQNQAGSLTSTEASQIKEKLAGSPYSESDWCLYIKCHGGTSTGHLGGFYFGNQSRANAVFIVKVSAKIPVGYTLKNAHNSHGTGYKQEFLTPMVGTGKYETYIFKETCGPTGTFNTVNHLYLSGPVTTEAAPCEWFVDYATVFDQTSDGYADIEIVTKDSFAVQLGFTNFEALKANALTKGPLIKAGLINADVIDVNTLAANNAFIDKLRTNILKANVITANMISVIGFTFADNKIIGGKDFGVGPGVKVTSTDSEKSFKAYKDASNYISMYYNSASDWGLKGVVGGAELLKLGITNKLGPFAIEGSWLRGSNLALSGSQLNFSYSGHQVYVGSHPDMTTAGNAKLGTFMLSGGGYGGLGSNKQVALIAGAPNNGNSYAMAVTQGMLKMFSNAHIVSGVSRAYMTGTNPGITLGNEHPNMICLYGTGNRKKVNLYAGMEIGSHFFITSEASQGFDVLCTGSERFYRNGNTYVAVQSSGQDTVLVMKTDTYKWTACQLPINWLGTWNP